MHQQLYILNTIKMYVCLLPIHLNTNNSTTIRCEFSL